MDDVVDIALPSTGTINRRGIMKDCCKTGTKTEQKSSGLKRWLNYALYIIIGGIVIGALILQLTNNAS